MPRAAANGTEIEYEEHGDGGLPVVLLVSGLGSQLIGWEDAFVRELTGRHYRVVRFDNRDVGLSSWFDEAGVPVGAAEPPYTLGDMADDAVGLLDALGVESAHIVGASMGGMIAQALALAHPGRALSLTCIYSSPSVEAARPGLDILGGAYLAPASAPGGTGTEATGAAAPSREEVIEAVVARGLALSSPVYPPGREVLYERAAAAYDRAFHPAGAARQVLAVAAQEDRTAALRQLRLPTLVVHGDADSMVDPAGGRAIAEAVPGAELVMVPGMGHDIPRQLYPMLAGRIADNCGRAAL